MDDEVEKRIKKHEDAIIVQSQMISSLRSFTVSLQREIKILQRKVRDLETKVTSINDKRRT